jgi:hypothetical protein
MNESSVVMLIIGVIIGYFLKTLDIASEKRRMRNQLSRWSWPKETK